MRMTCCFTELTLYHYHLFSFALNTYKQLHMCVVASAQHVTLPHKHMQLPHLGPQIMTPARAYTFLLLNTAECWCWTKEATSAFLHLAKQG